MDVLKAVPDSAPLQLINKLIADFLQLNLTFCTFFFFSYEVVKYFF